MTQRLMNNGSALFVLAMPTSASVRQYGAEIIGIQRLPTDPIGTFTLTLTNVVIDSRVVVRDQANTTTFYNALAASSTVVIVLQVYSAGSPLNLLRIDVRKTSAAPFYQRYKTLMTAAVGAASVYINQLPDQR